MSFNKYESWVGLGAKGGGILGVVGFETVDGRVWNLSGLQTNDFLVGGLRLGLGLGGGGGLVAIFVYNCLNIYDLNDKDLSNYSAKPGDAPSSPGVTDININVSIGGKWSDLTKLLKKNGLARTAIKIVKNKLKLTPGDLSELRNLGHHVYSFIDTTTGGSSPKVVVIDIPAAGVGLEVSAYILAGAKFTISNPVT